MNFHRRFLSVAIAVGLAVPFALAAHTHVATPSTWSINLKESDFGTGPSSTSDTFVMKIDTDQWLEYSEVAVQSDGTTLKTSWSGPQDGTMHPIQGIPGGRAAVTTATDSAVFTFPDKSRMNCEYSASQDQKKYFEKCVITMADATTVKQKLTYDRVK